MPTQLPANRHRWLIPGLFALLVMLALSLMLMQPGEVARAASITVNTAADGAPADDGQCTLREAIIAANTDTASGINTGECGAGAGNDTISFAGVYTIDLDNVQGSLSITSNITIIGNGTIIEGDPVFPSVPPSAVPNDFTLITISSGDVIMSNLTLRHGVCTSITCGGNGGAIYAAGNSLTLTGMTIQNNYADSNGGGIYNDDSVVTITGSTLSGNYAYFSRGGAIHNTGSGYVSISSSTIGGSSAVDGNIACEGGGLFSDGDGSSGSGSVGLYITGSTIQNNQTFGTCTSGGGLLNLNTAAIENTTFADNTTNFGAGGGIENSGSSAILTLNNVNFTNNRAAGFSYGGGGLANVNDASATITGGQFTGNSTVGDGGAIIGFDGTLNMTNVTVGTSGSPNTADGDGGGLYLINTSGTISGGSISHNTATDSGGGMLFESGPLTLNGVMVSNNTANSSTDGGGGIFVSVGTLNLNNTTVSGNTAPSAGGGGILIYDGTLNIIGSTIGPSNSAATFGGGLFAISGSPGVAYVDVNIYSSVFKSNSAPNGAGIAADEDATVTVINSTVAANTASDTGGGLWVNQLGQLNLYNITVSINSAVNGGAGIDDSFGASTWFNTIMAGNSGPTECTFTGISTSHSLTIAGSGCPYNVGNGDVQVADAASLLLNPFDGIKRQPISGSPALGAGNGTTCSGPPVNGTDQLGTTRGNPCTIGAIEAAYVPPSDPPDDPPDNPPDNPPDDPTPTDTLEPTPTNTPVIYFVDPGGETVEPPDDNDQGDDPTPSPTPTDTPEPDAPPPTFTPTPEIILAAGCRIVSSEELSDDVLLSAAEFDEYGVQGWLICDEPVTEVCIEVDQDIEDEFDDTRARLLDCRADTCTDYEIARITGNEICINTAAAAGLTLPNCTEGCAIADETESGTPFIIPLLIILALLALIMLVLFLLLGRRQRGEQEEEGEEEIDDTVVGGNS